MSDEFRKGAEWMQRRAMSAISAACPRAHTYASENADVYRAYDKAAADAIVAVRAIAVPAGGPPKSKKPVDVRTIA